jgi:molecular chaperone HtpG
MRQNFQVNLRGVIELLSNHLYSSPAVFVRELLQNGVDALTARAALETGRASAADRSLRVQVRQGEAGPEILFEDGGIGLSEDEVHRFLATLGESSKRRVDGAGAPLPTDLLGQFGIGILACFLVSDEIVVLTRSCRTPDAEVIEWRGRQDGTYSVRKLEGVDRPPGTSVSLRARPDRLDWFEPARVRELLSFYGSQLEWPILFTEGGAEVRINGRLPPWRDRFEDRSELDDAVLAYGRAAFGTAFLDWIPLRAQGSETEGVAFVLPLPPNLAEPRRHRVYLKGMLVSDRSTELVPPWAFFVQCVLDSRRLRPTASREALYEDELLEQTRDELGAGLRAWLLHIARHDPRRLTTLIAVHHRAIKALAAVDDDVLALFADHLPFETTQGHLAFSEIRASAQRAVRYAPSVDAFRQMAPVATAQGKLLVNGGYAYDTEVLLRAARLHELECEPLEATALTEELDDLSPREQSLTEAFCEAAQAALTGFGCEVALRSFRPEELSAFYASDGELEQRRDLERAREKTSGLWSDLLGSLQAGRPAAAQRPVLCLNYRNPLVRRLAGLDDLEAVKLAVRLLYVHALLLGHRPLRAIEQQLLPQAILGFVAWGLDSRGTASLQ